GPPPGGREKPVAPKERRSPGPRPAAAAVGTPGTEEIRGALGRVPVDGGDGDRGLRRRALTLLAVVGPGLIVMVGDNDAGGVATYAQAGQDYGYSLLWVLLLLIPVLVVNQEMVVRLGAVTGVGHARLIMERFGRFWGWFSVGDLFVLNFLTLVTEFIGVSLAASYLGVPRYVAVPLAAVVLIAVTTGGAFHRWERAMFVFIAVSLLIVPLTLLSEPRWGQAAHDFVVPGVRGGITGDAVLLVIAIVGTTVAPWQLFFQQSNVIDKRITPRFIGYERADTFLGSLVVVTGAAALMMVADFAVRGTPAQGHFTDAAGVAQALGGHSHALGVMFAVVLLDASIVGAAAVTLATSYAFGDVFHLQHSLHRGFREARPFYLSYSLLVLAAASVVLIPGAPLGVITEAVQALAGLLLPSATVFLLLLCNDRDVLGPWANPRWLNVLAGLIIAVLLLLSGTLMVSTLFPHLDVGRTLLVLAGALTAALGPAAVRAVRHRTARPGIPVMTTAEKAAWRMPPLTLLQPVRWSAGRRAGMVLLRGYLLAGALLLLVKAVRLGTG
ncbi:NRAMP family divalent metal transporter, partial [Streptomyces clavuligerus]